MYNEFTKLYADKLFLKILNILRHDKNLGVCVCVIETFH